MYTVCGDHMEFYAVQPAFYEYLKAHKNMIEDLMSLQNAQLCLMFYKMEEMELKDMMERCLQKTVSLNDHVLSCWSEELHGACQIEVKPYSIHFLSEQPMILDCLKRLYRYWIVI